ncbi:hypothetical protein [Paracoccus sp. MKU1]|uniref:hypothetical protein n=1 Tax=Paracoccus sp. MKU1 TaxID=1745182 RepID=UPI0007297D03|nr:hypothetical protein [Paracoccus sp. MKU1]KRW97852.1 hypothetical protein AQY21_01360 [Paracoccus sp. MKU1]
MTTIGRKELYERVWQTPMVRLSKEYGISDQGLAKICKRHAIPVPPRGHWIRKETGKPVMQVPLPDLPEGVSEHIRIEAASKSLVQAMAAKKQEKTARADLKEVSVPDDLRSLHPIVAGWIAEHNKAQAARLAEIRATRKDSWWKPSPIRDLTERDLYRFRITSALFKGVVANGGKAIEGQIGGAIVIEFAGERIKLAVAEKMRQLLKSRSEEDKAWTAYPDLHNSALHPTGFLRVTIDTYYGGTFRKEWVETGQKKGAAFLPEVLAGLKVIGDALVVRRREAQEEERRREERRMQEAERQRLLKLEAERWDHFRKWASDWEEAQRLRAFLAAVQATPLKDEIDGMPAEDWLNWLRWRIDKLDPLASSLEDGG